MRALKWRRILLGPRDTIQLLRRAPLLSQRSLHDDTIEKDIVRTFSDDDWFHEHVEPIANILSTYAYTNEGMGYVQGMAYLVFILYRCFYEDCPLHAETDTYYAFHTLINAIRPIYPIHSRDLTPVDFHRRIGVLVFLTISSQDQRLARRVKALPEVVELLTRQTIPSIFGNKFAYAEVVLIFDFILNPSPSETFHRIVCVLAATIVALGPVFLSMDAAKIMEIVQIKEYYDVTKIIALARRLL